MKRYNLKSNYFFLLLMTICMISCGGEKASTNANASTSNASGTNTSAPYERASQAPAADRTLENLDVKINLKNAQPGKYLLMGVFTDQYYIADSTRLDGKQVRFQKNESVKPGVYFCYFPDQSTSFQIIIDADQQFEMSTDVTNIIDDMKVKGSVDNELLYEALRYDRNVSSGYTEVSEIFKTYKPGDAEHNAAIAKHKKLNDDKQANLRRLIAKAPNSLFASFKESGQNPNIQYDFTPNGALSEKYLYDLRNQYWDNVNFEDVRLLYSPVIANKMENFFTKFVNQTPDSIKHYASKLLDPIVDKPEYFKYIANWITLKYEPTKTSLMDAEAVFVHMIQNYFTKERAFWQDSVQTHGLQLRAYEMGQSLVGQKGPDVTAKGPDGKSYSIYDIPDEYIAVYLWNPDCDHCQEQTPKLVNLHKRLKPQGFEVYAIVIETEDARWKEAIGKYRMNWINVHDPTNRAIYAKYFVDNTPELYLLNKEREIIGKNLKVFQVEQVIEQDKMKKGK